MYQKKFNKKFDKPNFKRKRIFTEADKKKIAEIDKEAKDLLKKISEAEKKLENKESIFKDENIGKPIVLIDNNGNTIEGELLDIDKYRIKIKNEGIEKFYYKHALVEYYKK